MKLRAKIERSREETMNPESNGIVPQKVGLDLKIIGPNGELDNDEVIEGGFAYQSRFGFTNEAGEEVILFEGAGDSGERVPDDAPREEHPGCAIPNGGYTERGSGISAILDSNGLRMYPNFKKLPEGYYRAFAEVKGVGRAEFPFGDRIRTGKARPPRHGS